MLRRKSLENLFFFQGKKFAFQNINNKTVTYYEILLWKYNKRGGGNKSSGQSKKTKRAVMKLGIEVGEIERDQRLTTSLGQKAVALYMSDRKE